MEIIPAIDLLDGRCVRLYQGDYSQQQVYSTDPVAVARDFVAQGATRVHLVDLDGAKAGEQRNLEVIAAIAQAVTVPVQVGGGLRSYEAVTNLLARGVHTAIIGTAAVENPELVSRLCGEFPGHIAVGIDARDGKVATRGWLETSEMLASDLAQQMAAMGVAAIIYTDIHRDGTLAGPNMPALRAIAEAVTVPVIASGGVSAISDLLGLLTLEPLGVTGVIVGRAIYAGAFSVREAIQAVGNGRFQDVPLDLGDSTFA